MIHIKTYEKFSDDLTYDQVLTLIKLEKPIRDYIIENYPEVKIPKRNNLFSKTLIYKIKNLIFKKYDIKLKRLFNDYLDYLKEIEIEQDANKYNV